MISRESEMSTVLPAAASASARARNPKIDLALLGEQIVIVISATGRWCIGLAQRLGKTRTRETGAVDVDLGHGPEGAALHRRGFLVQNLAGLRHLTLGPGNGARTMRRLHEDAARTGTYPIYFDMSLMRLSRDCLVFMCRTTSLTA